MAGKPRNTIASYEKQFQYFRTLGEKAMEQISDEQLFESGSIEENSIAVIVRHLWGNMLSRWTDFLKSDGEKTWRDRDSEFQASEKSRIQVLEKWNEGWECLLGTLGELNDTQLQETVYIRNQGHSVLEAINRQLAHYAYHVGQIVHLTKQFKGEQWKSLSIPRNASKSFNREKFDQKKGKAHYTDEWVGRSQEE